MQYLGQHMLILGNVPYALEEEDTLCGFQLLCFINVNYVKCVGQNFSIPTDVFLLVSLLITDKGMSKTVTMIVGFLYFFQIWQFLFYQFVYGGYISRCLQIQKFSIFLVGLPCIVLLLILKSILITNQLFFFGQCVQAIPFYIPVIFILSVYLRFVSCKQNIVVFLIQYNVF